MRGEIAAFVDTNVLVYALSTDDPRKQERASSIVARGFSEGLLGLGVLPFAQTRTTPAGPRFHICMEAAQVEPAQGFAAPSAVDPIPGPWIRPKSLGADLSRLNPI